MATSKISEVLNYFSRGFQRTNRFEVEIQRGNESAKTFWATSCQVPSQTVVFYPDSFSPSGPPINIPIKKEYDERFLIDFIVERNWAVRKYFEDWMDNFFTTLNVGLNTTKANSIFPRNNTANLGTVTVKAMSETDEVNTTFVLYEAYPKLLLPSTFSNDEPGNYLTLSVDFNYRYYKIF